MAPVFSLWHSKLGCLTLGQVKMTFKRTNFLFVELNQLVEIMVFTKVAPIA